MSLSISLSSCGAFIRYRLSPAVCHLSLGSIHRPSLFFRHLYPTATSLLNLRGKSQFKHHCYHLYHDHHHHHDQNEQNHKIPMNRLAHLGPKGGPSYKWLSHSAREIEPVQGNNYVGIDAILSIQYATDVSMQHSWYSKSFEMASEFKVPPARKGKTCKMANAPQEGRKK